jgi:ankyrin repeat protein
VRALLAAGADPNLADDRGGGYTPLAWATQNNDVETAQTLLDAGADPNLRVYGRTPLAMAEDLDRPAVARLLASHGGRADREPDDPRLTPT